MRSGNESPKILLLTFLIFCLGTLLFAGCQKEEETDECEKTAKPLSEPMFRIYFRLVNEADQTPYAGAVEFQSEKHYCDGTTSGSFSDQADITNGFWKPITTQYKLANTEDYVLVTLYAGEYQDSWDLDYRYVKDNMKLEDFTTWVLEDTITVSVP
jgi:hypothetical protein